MDERSTNDEVSHQLLDLIPKDREWHMNRDQLRSHKSSEDRKLELRLGPPGEDWSLNDNSKNINRGREESLLSLGYFSAFSPTTQNPNNGCQTQKITTSENPVGAILPSPWAKAASFLQFPSSPQSMPVMGMDASQPCCSKVVDLQNAEKKAFSPSSANPAVPNSSQKRTASGPVVGWPPIRSFRKNLASASASGSKPPSESQRHHQHVVADKVAGKKPIDNSGNGNGKGLFVKINMDGVPIGRKVDINAYDSYDKLSYAVDDLFRGLLTAPRDSSACAGGIHNKQEGKAITGLLDGSGEYTLVYEDNEGDRMLVGDVPWHSKKHYMPCHVCFSHENTCMTVPPGGKYIMFVSTVKRLRVLKSSELSAFTLGGKEDKNTLDSAMK